MCGMCIICRSAVVGRHLAALVWRRSVARAWAAWATSATPCPTANIS